MKNKLVGRLLSPACNERGIALIVALIMLAVMSLLGALAMTTTESELAITTNVRAANEAFLAADRAAEFAMSSGAIISNVGAGSVDLNTYAVAGKTFPEMIEAGKGRLNTDVDNQLWFLAAGAIPAREGFEYEANSFEGRYYGVNVNGGVVGHPAVSRIEVQFVRVFPKP